MAGTDAGAALDGFSRKLRRIPGCLRKTLTYDQGKEMARHEELARRVHIQVYFADPHTPGNGRPRKVLGFQAPAEE